MALRSLTFSLLLLAIVAAGCESNNIVSAIPTSTDSVTVSGIVFLVLSADTLSIPGASIRATPYSGITYSDSVGRYSIRIDAEGDTVLIMARQEGYTGDFVGWRYVVIPPDRHDLREVDIEVHYDPI